MEGERVGELGDLLRGRAGEARELCRRAHVACEFHLGGGSRHGQPRGGGKILPPPWSGEAGGRPRAPGGGGELRRSRGGVGRDKEREWEGGGEGRR